MPLVQSPPSQQPSTASRSDETRSLRSKTCLVTGSSRGIGREVARVLARHGAHTVINFRSSRDRALDLKESIDAFGGTALVCQADVTKRNELETMRDRIHDAFGTVDVLVNNAGMTIDKKFEQITRDDWDTVMEVNLGGTFNCTQVFYDDLKRSEAGRLINVSSVVGQQGNYGQASYATSKSGLFGLTRTLAQELARHDATANCVAPGFTKTDMIDDVPEKVLESIRDQIPMRRFADVEEIAGLIRFLASDESSYITGQVLSANGGMHCH